MGALEDAREAAALPVGLPPGVRPELVQIAQLLSVDAAAGLATISLHGSQPITLPCAPWDYTGYTTVRVMVDQFRDAAVYVMSPNGHQVDLLPPPAAPSGASATATILPTSTGTWRATRAAWDRWSGGSGATSDLYQGSSGDSGALVGLACYADQVLGLGAASITAVRVAVTRVGTGSSDPVALVVQGAPHGARPAGAPSRSGDTAQVLLPRGGAGDIALPASVREGLRTGAVKGLCLVGAGYAGAKGVARADGMALHVTYTRPA